MLVAIVVAATILAFAGYMIAGRVIGLSITAFCSASMAYFVMPPVFSFRVSQTHDLLALALYGTAGLLLAKMAPARGRRGLVRVDWPSPVEGPGRAWTELSTAMAILTSSELGYRLQVLDVNLPQDRVMMPCTRDEAVRILADILTTVLQIPGVRRASIFGAQQPGVRRLTVAAHYAWPPPLRKVIHIGRRDEDCEALIFAGWLPHWRATWFDNGYDRIFQISIGT